MSADTVIKDDLLMRQDTGLEVDESTGMLDEISKLNRKNFTANMNAIAECSTCWFTLVIGCILVFTMLFKYKNPLQFYVKFSVYVVMTMIYAMCFIPIAMFRPNNARNIE